MPFSHLPVHKKREFTRWLYCIGVCWILGLGIIVLLTAKQTFSLHKTKKQIQQLQQDIQPSAVDEVQRNGITLAERKKRIEALRKKKNRFTILQQIVGALPEKTTLTQFSLSKKQLELSGMLTDHTVLSELLNKLQKLPILQHIAVTSLSQSHLPGGNEHFNFSLKADILEE